MEALTEFGIALFVAALLISLFAILRLATRSQSSPAWLTSELTAYTFAVPFTIAVAGSLSYVGFALQPVVGVFFGVILSIAIHLVLLAVFRFLLPVRDAAPASQGANRTLRTQDQVTA